MPRPTRGTKRRSATTSKSTSSSTTATTTVPETSQTPNKRQRRTSALKKERNSSLDGFISSSEWQKLHGIIVNAVTDLALLAPTDRSAVTELLSALKPTINGTECSSVLLMGPRGVGKTSVISTVRSKLTDLVSDEDGLGGEAVVWLTLHGRLHTDDRTAFNALARQASAQGVSTESVSLDQLLGGLGPDDEDDDDEEEEGGLIGEDGLSIEASVSSQKQASFAEALRAVISAITGSSRPVILVLEEFDAFASRPRQVLLYTMLDILQQKVRLALVGTTTRVDAVEALDKRVQSRFSHHMISVAAPSSEELLKTIQAALSVPESALDAGADGSSAWREAHNEEMEALVTGRASSLASAVSRLCAVSNSVQSVVDVLRLALARSWASQSQSSSEPVSRALLDGTHIEAATREVLDGDEGVKAVAGLSLLELYLLVSLRKLSGKVVGSHGNFELFYSVYKTHLAGAGGVTHRMASKSMARRAFEHLLAMELVETFSGSASGGAGGGGIAVENPSMAGSWTASAKAGARGLSGWSSASATMLREFAPVRLSVSGAQIDAALAGLDIPTDLEQMNKKANSA